MSVLKATDSDFNNLIQTHPLVMVKYYADWCGSCRLMAPKYNQLADEIKDVTFLDVNAEENPAARKLADVSNLPFFATFRDGKLQEADFTAKIETVREMTERLRV